MLFVSYGGDGGVFGNGSVLAYDLVAERVVWTVKLKPGSIPAQVSPDGKLLYMPTGENSTSGIWNILSTSNGDGRGHDPGRVGRPQHGRVRATDNTSIWAGATTTTSGSYETSTGKIRSIGPLVEGVRPFTVNGSNTLAFTTATNLDGFQVSSITTGKALFTVSFGAVPSGFAFSRAKSRHRAVPG